MSMPVSSLLQSIRELRAVGVQQCQFTGRNDAFGRLAVFQVVSCLGNLVIDLGNAVIEMIEISLLCHSAAPFLLVWFLSRVRNSDGLEER